MRIHLVSEHASPLALLGGADAGGQNVHVAALAIGLAEFGADVVVHTRRDDPTLPRSVELAPGVTVDHVDAGPAEPLSKDELLPWMGEFADDLHRQWSTLRPDVVHAHYWMSALAAVDAGARLDVPVAVTYHALGLEKRRHQGDADTSPTERCDIEAWLAGACDHVIATSRAERATMLDFGADPARVTVIPCGVDLGRFRPARTAGRDGPRVVCVSRLVPRKGIAEVIEAVAGLDGVELVIAGGPRAAMLDDDPYARELIALIERLGANERIRLTGGIERDEVPDLMHTADVVCCTPWYEPFGMVAVEAMACGVPTVATAVGGLAETVVHGGTGLHVQPRRPEMIRRAVATILDDPRRAAAMGVASVIRAAEFGWPRIAAMTYSVLAGLAADAESVRRAAVGGAASGSLR
jgi:glycosyltransferase involved in cell wall biosynthesis